MPAAAPGLNVRQLQPGCPMRGANGDMRVKKFITKSLQCRSPFWMRNTRKLKTAEAIRGSSRQRRTTRFRQGAVLPPQLKRRILRWWISTAPFRCEYGKPINHNVEDLQLRTWAMRGRYDYRYCVARCQRLHFQSPD